MEVNVIYYIFSANANSAAPLSKSAARNKKKREAKKQKEEEAKTQNVIVFEEPDFSSKKSEKPKAPKPQQTAGSDPDTEKKAKNLKKVGSYTCGSTFYVFSNHVAGTVKCRNCSS